MTNHFKNFFKKFDYSFIAISFFIFLIGLLNLYSATHYSVDLNYQKLYSNQIVYFVLSFLLSVILSFIHPKNYFRSSYLLYIVVIILLVFVLLFGSKAMGAQRWLSLSHLRLQPSEFMKIALVLSLSRWLSKDLHRHHLHFSDLIIPLLFVLVPFVLILMQPDLGTALLLFLIFAVIIFYCKLNVKVLGVVSILVVLAAGFMFQYGLKDYQKKRIMTFLNPDADAKGSGYNAIQSKIAIGSGMLWGKGFKKSSQATFNYLPENHTDFVFSIYNEEHGFIGAIFLIILFFIFFMRMIWLAQNCTRLYDSLVVIGIMSIFFWHALINMSMVMGLMPVVGLPLPYMSYGGSSLVTFGMCIGILSSISRSRMLFIPSA
jgi:rod shape determining protein RodA